MGKISEALEKAQNKNAFRPKKKPAPENRRNKKIILDPLNDGQDYQEDGIVLNADISAPKSLSASMGKDGGKTSDQHFTPEEQISSSKEAESGINLREKQPRLHMASSDSRYGEPSLSPRTSTVSSSADQQGESFLNESNKVDEKKPVRVQYSKTKVQHSDPERLKNGHVLSLFEDVETTNQFKMLRTQVLRKLKAIGGNSILVTSANPCEGKTFTSINLGVSIAKEFDRTVLIIDADIRRPLKQHTDFATEFFSLKVDKGLTDYLEGEADIQDVLINPGIDKLTLIPGGVPVDNSPELLNSSRMEKMMSELKSRYKEDRLVILDGPAILHFPDAMILYKYVDGVLPVIEAERTSNEDVKKMMEILYDVNVLGAVMNKNRG